MKKTIGLCGLAMAMAIGSPGFAQTIQGCYPITLDDAATLGPPRFEDFPAAVATIAKPAPVDLKSSPKAKEFRTALQDGAKGGPDFAGHYTIVGCGCGSACLDFAIVDAKNGHVFFPPEIGTVSVNDIAGAPGEPPPKFDALRYRANSDLLVLLGAPHEDQTKEGIAYYRWDGTSLTLVKFLPSAKNPCPDE